MMTEAWTPEGYRPVEPAYLAGTTMSRAKTAGAEVLGVIPEVTQGARTAP